MPTNPKTRPAPDREKFSSSELPQLLSEGNKLLEQGEVWDALERSREVYVVVGEKSHYYSAAEQESIRNQALDLFTEAFRRAKQADSQRIGERLDEDEVIQEMVKKAVARVRQSGTPAGGDSAPEPSGS